MRSVSATLATAQTATKRVPYFQLKFYRNDDAVNAIDDLSCSGNPDDTTAKLMYLRIFEFPYSSGDESSPSVLYFEDSARAIPDLRGCYVDIGIGDVTGDGDEYATLPRMWVKQQTIVSAPSGIMTKLTLEGVWEKLDKEHARLDNGITDPALFYLVNKTTTPYDIMAIVLNPTYSYFTFTLDALTVDDGIIDTFLPYFTINAERDMYESKLSVLYRLISMTTCYIKPLASNHFVIVYPQESDATDLTIYSNQMPVFYEFHRLNNQDGPNTITIMANNTGKTTTGDGHENWPNLIYGGYVDTAAFERDGGITVKKHYLVPTITTQGDANNRAEAIMIKYKAEQTSQMLVIMHDCRIELYDHLLVTDSR